MDALYLGYLALLDGVITLWSTAPEGAYTINEIIASILTWGTLYLVIIKPLLKIFGLLGKR